MIATDGSIFTILHGLRFACFIDHSDDQYCFFLDSMFLCLASTFCICFYCLLTCCFSSTNQILILSSHILFLIFSFSFRRDSRFLSHNTVPYTNLPGSLQFCVYLFCISKILCTVHHPCKILLRIFLSVTVILSYLRDG